MLQPDSLPALPQWRGALSVALLAGLVLGATLAAAARMDTEEPPPQALSGSTEMPAPPLVPSSAVPAAAMEVKTAPAVPIEERQRRLFILLLMNSAGSLHPYGGLSR